MMFKQIIYIFIVTAIITTMASCSDQEQLQPLKTDATILAFGDSLTYGTGTSRDKAYPARLEKLIKRKVINAGVPGEITKKGLARLPGLLARYQPELIIICHGGNDILHKLALDQTKSNIQQMINLASQNNTQVVIISVPEFGLFLGPSPIYQALSDENHIPIDNNILGSILRKNAFKSDHVHPNTLGYQVLAEHIALLLKQSGAFPGT